VVAGLQPRMREFDPSSVNVRFVLDKITIGEAFLPS